MKILIEPTPEMYDAPINGVKVPTRVWVGVTEGGIAIDVYVLAIVPDNQEDSDKLRAEIPDFMKLARDTYTVDIEDKEK